MTESTAASRRRRRALGRLSDSARTLRRTVDRLFETLDAVHIVLGEVATGPQFRHDIEFMAMLKGQGRFYRGSIKGTVNFERFTRPAQEALLLACLDGRDVHLFEKATGKDITDPARFPRFLFRVTMRREQGAWKTYNTQYVRDC